jgi:hypothetical protein
VPVQKRAAKEVEEILKSSVGYNFSELLKETILEVIDALQNDRK